MIYRKQHPLYNTWRTMRQRCFRKTYKNYSSYGGRGITICERWDEFWAFVEDMGDKPDGTSLERIDNDKGYSKENCRWATFAEQNRNTRNSRFIEFGGKRMCVIDWTRELGLSIGTIHHRLKRGLPIEQVLKGNR